MKIKLKLFLYLFLLSTSALAQITAPSGTGGGVSCGAASGVTSCFSGTTVNVQVGDTLVAFLQTSNSASVPNMGLGPPCNVSWPTPYSIRIGTIGIYIWVLPHAATAGTGCAFGVGGLQGANTFLMQIYRGVQSIGPIPQVAPDQITTNTTVAAPPATTATQAGNVLVGVMGHSANPGTITPQGTTQVRRTGTYATMMDVTATAADEVIRPIGTSVNGTTYVRAVVELFSAPVSHPATLSDAMQTMLMDHPGSLNYTLPSTGLSPTWCTWFMPIGSSANNYEIEPQSTQLNGQSNPVKIPSWQMTRICQDNGGHFWASPPLLAGAGISITGAADGVRISSTGAGGMTYVAGGTAHLPGTVALSADSCGLLYTSTATGVLTSDVVSYTPVGTPSGTWVHVVFRPTISNNDAIAWNGCNVSSSSVTPAARDMNWYVARHTVGAVAARHKVVHKTAGAKKQ